MNKQKMKRFLGNFTFNYQKKLERSLRNGWTISTNWHIFQQLWLSSIFCTLIKHAVSSVTWCISSDLNMQI